MEGLSAKCSYVNLLDYRSHRKARHHLENEWSWQLGTTVVVGSFKIITQLMLMDRIVHYGILNPGLGKNAYLKSSPICQSVCPCV